MLFKDIDIPVRNVPELDEEFIPMQKFNEIFLSSADVPFGIAIEQADGTVCTCSTFVHGTRHSFDLDCFYIKRLVKAMLWVHGGSRVCICGDTGLFNCLQYAFSPEGEFGFDGRFMSFNCGKPFEVVQVDALPEEAPLFADSDGIAPSGAGEADCMSELRISMDFGVTAKYTSADGVDRAWLNGLAMIPIDAARSQMPGEFKPENFCGNKYLSQAGLIRLASDAGIEFSDYLPASGKLEALRELFEDGDEKATQVYHSFGVYLAHTLAYYYSLYSCPDMVLSGSVLSGMGGQAAVDICKAVLADEYAEISEKLNITMAG